MAGWAQGRSRPGKAGSPRRAVCALLLWAGVAILGSPMGAQTILDFREELDRERPEAWAMAYFGSLVILTRLAEPTDLAAGEWTVGVEGGWVPSLSEEERRVGFDGAKVEDLNRTSAVGRVRGAVGLPGRFVLGLAWMPPLEVDGMEANLVSASLGRSMALRGRWRLGVRGTLTDGEIEGDITCDRATVAAGDDPIANPFGCLEPSRDQMSLRVASVELLLSRDGRAGRWSPFGGVLGSWFDNEFEVDARYGDIVDRTRLEAEHAAGALVLGVVHRSARRWSWAGEVFYTPLRVRRASGTETDALLHGRLHLTYRLP